MHVTAPVPIRSTHVSGGGGCRIRVDETGNPNGKAVLFIHGFSQSRMSWDKQLHAPGLQDLRLLAMDLRGHGDSDRPEGAYGDSQLWADDVRAVIEQCNVDQPVLVGWSYGGFVIGDYLGVNGASAIAGIDLVGAGSVIGQGPDGLIGTEFASMFGGYISDNVGESIPALSRFLRLCVHEEPTPQDMAFMLGMNVIVSPQVRLGLFSRSVDYADTYRAFIKPTRITHGVEDQIVTFAMGQRNFELLPHAHMSAYENCGHCPFWEQPERYNTELGAFRRSV
jgi:non-heme chloroperoxidase